jgi:hypothetical protein
VICGRERKHTLGALAADASLAADGVFLRRARARTLAGRSLSCQPLDTARHQRIDGPHVQVAPLTAFSEADLSQLHWPAAFWPHEQVASAAQAHSALVRPQQVMILGWNGVI